MSSVKSVLIALVATSLLSCSSGSDNSGTTPPASERKLLLLFTSDEHSQLFASSPQLDDFPLATTAGSGALRGGIARRATILGAERSAADAAGEATLVLSSGDNHFGALPSLTFRSGSSDYAAMHALGYAATTIGNHELDLGPAALAEAISAAASAGELPPIVASNIHFSASDPGDDTLAALFSEDPTDDKPIHRYRVLALSNGVRVGLVGYVGVNASNVAPNKTPVSFSEQGVDPGSQDDPDVVLPKLYADLQPIVDEVRQQADVVVALSHAGLRNLADVQNGEDYRIAQNVAGIDVILSGHAHQDDPAPIVVKNLTTGKDVLVLNASYYGRDVGRVELTLPAESASAAQVLPALWDLTTQKLVPVDDRTIPDPDASAATLTALSTIEATPALQSLVTRVEGQPVTATTPGSLYFRKIAHTAFDVVDTHALMFLTADAQLAAADTVEPTDMALQSAGVVRGVLAKGKTGDISVADAFSVVPLGSSPVDGSYGYPLVRAYLGAFYIRAIFEFSSTLGPTDSDFDLATAGMRVEYDCTRPPVTSVADLLDTSKGRVVRIYLDTDHSNGVEDFDKLIYERGGTAADPGPFSIVTSSYIAQFASSVGATLQGKDGHPIALADAILHRPDGSGIKETEAFLGYLKNGLGGEVPARYDGESPQASSRFAGFASCGN